MTGSNTNFASSKSSQKKRLFSGYVPEAVDVALSFIFGFVFLAFDSAKSLFRWLVPEFAALNAWPGKYVVFPVAMLLEFVKFNEEAKAFRQADTRTIAHYGRLAVATVRVSAVSAAIIGGAISFVVGTAASFGIAAGSLFLTALGLVGLSALTDAISEGYYAIKHRDKSKAKRENAKTFFTAIAPSSLATISMAGVLFTVAKLFLIPAIVGASAIAGLAAVASPVGIAAVLIGLGLTVRQIRQKRRQQSEDSAENTVGKNALPKEALPAKYKSLNKEDYYFSLKAHIDSKAGTGATNEQKQGALKTFIAGHITYIKQELLLDKKGLGFKDTIKRFFVNNTRLKKRYSDQLAVLEDLLVRLNKHIPVQEASTVLVTDDPLVDSLIVDSSKPEVEKTYSTNRINGAIVHIQQRLRKDETDEKKQSRHNRVVLSSDDKVFADKLGENCISSNTTKRCSVAGQAIVAYVSLGFFAKDLDEADAASSSESTILTSN